MSFATLAFVASAIVLGTLTGLAWRGELRNLANHGLRWLGSLGLGAALLFYVDRLSPDPSTELSLVGMALVAIFVLRNLHLVGFSIIFLGVALNIAGIALNQGMSVDREAAVSSGLLESSDSGIRLEQGGRHVRAGSDRAWWLGEVIPIAPLRDNVSFGDLIATAGALNAAFRLTQRKAQRRPALSPSARAGLVAIEAAGVRLDDEPVIDLRLMAEASQKGYAEAWRNSRRVVRVHELHTPPADRKTEAAAPPVDVTDQATQAARDPSTIAE